ncbi:TPA: helix-turn-helix transcriptional regulator [Vibrio parahaemolyticus]|nr:helix-turn-helix transcriptional regulator [Vibrio parahaemolyticus]HCE3229323.1 helix-turn-helix transcriptional regulator [Vibrio parahaemolyticus]
MGISSRMSSSMTKIGLRIKELRCSKNITQDQLAKTCDLDRTYISSVENGKRNISIKAIEAIASALDVSLSELFEGM